MKDRCRGLIAGLYLVSDSTLFGGRDYIDLVTSFVAGGAKVVELDVLSDNYIWSEEVFAMAMDIMRLKKKYDFTFIVGDYVDVAAEAKADGIMIRRNKISVGEIRKRVGDRLLVGCCAHSEEEAISKIKGGADYLLFGPVFPSRDFEADLSPQGVGVLERVVGMSDIPIVAAGGINRENIDSVLATGVRSVSIISAIRDVDNMVKEISFYLEKIASFANKGLE